MFGGNTVRLIGIIVIGLVIAAALAGAWGAGKLAGYSHGYNTRIRELGLTRGSAGLYQRAAKLLNRLAQLTDLDGAMAGDNLSPETKAQVTEWVADYKREISK